MKQLITITLTILFSFASYGQDPVLFETDWYLHELNIEDETIFPPEGNTTSMNFTEEPQILGDSDFNGMTLHICNEFWGDVNFVDNSQYISMGAMQTLEECSLDELNQLEITYRLYFLQSDETYTTEVIYLGNSTTLYIYDNEGNYALYGNEQLSTQANNLSSVFIYPNPVTDRLYIQNFEQEFTSAFIYSLSGSKINIQIENNTLNVSNLTQGVYFLSLTTANGKKAINKFIKK